MQLAASFGSPEATSNINMGINLPADAPIIPKDLEFDANNAETYSASSSVTILDGRKS